MLTTINFIPLIQGFGVGAALIVAIGPQNAFVLKQGLKRQHMFVCAALCALIDGALISLGVGGLGRFLASHPTYIEVARWFGAAFLSFYGFQSFKAALHNETLDVATVTQSGIFLKQTVLTLLALSLLNPHVYLDTVILIGSIAAQHPIEEQHLFAVGAIFASFIWFFGIVYGARVLDPLFKKPIAWKILDFIIGIIMWSIALALMIE